jgi:DNA-binding MarR family transcriptional regulator
MVAPRAPPELAENIISLYNQYCMVNEAVIAEAARTGAAALDPVTVANRLRPVLLHLNRHLRQELHALGIGSSQVSLLAAIQANPGIGVGELATREGTSAPSVCNHIDRLEASGLVTRTREDGGDRRRVGLSCTAEGARVVRAVRSRRTAWLAARLSDLPEEQLRAIEGALAGLSALVER